MLKKPSEILRINGTSKVPGNPGLTPPLRYRASRLNSGVSPSGRRSAALFRMSFPDQLRRASEWLASVRNQDKGWGLAAGQASSIVNTAEAIYVLSKASSTAYSSIIADGLDFLQSKTIGSATKNPRTRYVFFSLFACLEHLEKVDRGFIDQCANWLLKARNNDGAWGHVANDQNSKLFPTVMSLLVLGDLGLKDDLMPACHWIISQQKGEGWVFSEEGQSSPIATALAVVALRPNDPLFVKPKEQLITVSLWGVETEDMPGTPWIHCSYMWIFFALTELGVEPYSQNHCARRARDQQTELWAGMEGTEQPFDGSRSVLGPLRAPQATASV